MSLLSSAVTLREEYKLQVTESKVTGKVIKPKMAEVSRGTSRDLRFSGWFQDQDLLEFDVV
jgi:hypothetical protein